MLIQRRRGKSALFKYDGFECPPSLLACPMHLLLPQRKPPFQQNETHKGARGGIIKLGILNFQIDLDLFNTSLNTFKIKMKRLFME